MKGVVRCQKAFIYFFPFVPAGGGVGWDSSLQVIVSRINAPVFYNAPEQFSEINKAPIDSTIGQSRKKK